MNVHALLKATLEFSKYAAAPFFSDLISAGKGEYAIKIPQTTPEWWEGMREQIEAIQPALEAAIAAAPTLGIPEGWKLVPVEPTAEMIDNAIGTCNFPRLVWHAMLSAAPTPPVPVLQLETQLSERDVKELSDYLAQVQAVPTPPAQEDEPVAFVTEENGEQVIDITRLLTLSRGTKIYARPANDELRKAAEEAVKKLDSIYPFLPEWLIDLRNDLRAALEK